jgi:hypothetical protein
MADDRSSLDPDRPHFLLTNFNVRLGWAHDADGVPVLTPEWMEHRWQLFQAFCLPSVRGQSTRRFRWLVRFDPATPEPDRRRFRQLTAGMTNVTPLWRAEPFSTAICSQLDRSAGPLLTTRLDNDDCLHRTAMARIQAAAGDTAPEFLNFPSGFRLMLPDGQLYRYTDYSNPFLSFVEPLAITAAGRLACRALPGRALDLLLRADRSDPRRGARAPVRTSLKRFVRTRIGRFPVTARHADHRYAADAAPVRQLSAEPAWLRVIHERNASVTRGSGEPCSLEGVAAAFGIRLPIAPPLGRGGA